MTSPNRIIAKEESVHQFVDRILVKMGRDELVNLLDITMDCLEEGTELAISHSKLRELADKGILQSYNRNLQLFSERNNHLETANDKITSKSLTSDECSSNIHGHTVSDSQLYKCTRHKQISEDRQISDLSSDQSHCIESNNLKNKKKFNKKKRTASDIISSDGCESEPVPKKLRYSQRKMQTTSKFTGFMFPVIRESRKKKIDDATTAKNKFDKIFEKSEFEMQSPHDMPHQLRSSNKTADACNDMKTFNEISSVRMSKKEKARENMPLSQRLRRGIKSCLHLFSHGNKQKLGTKYKNGLQSNIGQNEVALNKHSSQNLDDEIHKEQHLEDIVGITHKKKAHNNIDTLKLSSASKVVKSASPQTHLKLIEKDNTEVKETHEKSKQNPASGNELENIISMQHNVEESLDKLKCLNKDTGSKNKEKRQSSKNRNASISCHSNSVSSPVNAKTVSEPIILRLKSSENDRSNSRKSSSLNEEDFQPIKRNKGQQNNKKAIPDPPNVNDLTLPTEKQTSSSKTEHVTNNCEMQNKDGILRENEVCNISLPITSKNFSSYGIATAVVKNNMMITDIRHLSPVEWSSTNDDDTGKESSIGYETSAELNYSDSDYAQISSISENEYCTLNCELAKQSSSSLDESDELLSEEQEKHSSELDVGNEESCSSNKYEKLKEQFQRAGLDLDKVAQSVDEQKLKETIHKAGKDRGMLLRFPHFCPCSKKEVGQCLIILDSLRQYVKAKSKRCVLQN